MPEITCAVILAAGEGKRMKSSRPKVLSPVLFKPMLQWVLDAVKKAGILNVCVVTGYRHEMVEAYLQKESGLSNVEYVLQTERRGTGHAVMTADAFLRRFSGGDVLVLNGDAPFLDESAIKEAFAAHFASKNAATVISAEVEDPTGYGRIVRAPQGNLQAIVEQKDADEKTLQICEVNSGAYWFHVEDLLSVLWKIGNHNAQGEYYLPDAIQLLLKDGKAVGAFTALDCNAVLGANDCFQLQELNRIAREKILGNLMKDGVEIPCSDGILIGPDVSIGSEVCILPGTILKGKTTIGNGCRLGPNTLVDNAVIEENCVLNSVQCCHCTVSKGQTVPPYSVIE